MTHKVLVVYGTRPEAIKLAPVIRELAQDSDFEPVVVVTGQHREMLDQVNDLFGIVPDVDLDLMQHGATVNEITRAVLESLAPVLAELQPAAVVVQGDTTTAFAAAYAAFVAGYKVVHVEAGLRTGNRRSPFPEEANRRLLSVVADLHLAPTEGARANLLAEGFDPAMVLVTGNTVIDALHWVIELPVTFADAALRDRDTARRLVLVTAHRRESWGQPMRDSMAALARIARERADIDFVVPMHRNPVVREVITEALGDLPNVLLTEPLGYSEFTHLLGQAHLVVTDSGGVQEEAPGLAKPVLVLRDTTERPEGVAAGVVRLIGTGTEQVEREVRLLLEDEGVHDQMASAVNPYGDGRAARRCVAAIRHLVGIGPQPEAMAAAPSNE